MPLNHTTHCPQKKIVARCTSQTNLAAPLWSQDLLAFLQGRPTNALLNLTYLPHRDKTTFLPPITAGNETHSRLLIFLLFLFCIDRISPIETPTIDDNYSLHNKSDFRDARKTRTIILTYRQILKEGRTRSFICRYQLAPPIP